MRGHDPDDGAPRPGPTARQESLRVIEQGGHRCRQDGVVRARGDGGLFPSFRHDMRRHVKAGETRAHGRRRLDRRPRQRAIVQRRAELATAGADIEQTADLGHQPAHLRRDTRHVIGRIDRRGIELERIDIVQLSSRWKRGDSHDRLSGARRSSPRTVAVGAHCRDAASFYIRTPRPMRSRVTAASGRSPGSRVVAFDPLPGKPGFPVVYRSSARRLQLRGQPRRLPRSLLIPCGNHWRDGGSGCENRQRVKMRSPV
jgi:hypothetical protein